jgi:ABC-type glycerol-3-phosphate transport system substrate-binding protein
VLEAITLDGAIAALPSQTGGRLLYYNADLLADAGVKLPEPSWKWDREFLDAARKATRDTGAPESQRFGAEPAQGWPWYIPVWAYGGDLLTKDRRCGLTAAQAVNGLQFAADLAHRWRVTPNDAARATHPQGAFFDSGRLAFHVNGHHLYAQVQQRLSFKWGVAQLPQGPAGNKTTFDLWLTGICSGAKHHEAAWAFLSFSLQPEHYAEFLKYASWMPPVKGAERSPLVKDAQHWTSMAAALNSARLPPLLPQTDEMVKAMGDALAPVLVTGEQTARAATAGVCAKVDGLLAAAR